MAKVLISAIGTGPKQSERDYDGTVYKFPGSTKEYKTKFIASALCEHLKVDRLYLVGTAKSIWEEVYNYFSKAVNINADTEYWSEIGQKAESFKYLSSKSRITDEDLKTLNETIDRYLKSINSSATGGSQCFIIEYGISESELWDNFSTFMRICENLQENDEVYLDITHAFRSIALFNYITLDLISILKFKKAFKLSGLFYGMLDVKSELHYAPIVDLSSYYNMTMWARAAYDFTNFGNGYLLSELISDKDISEKIRDISEIVNINYIDDFKRHIDALNGLLENNRSSEPVIKYMFPYLINFTKRFKGINSSGKLQFALAEWYFDNKRYAQGYICLTESIITRLLEVYREKDNNIKWAKKNRDCIKNLILNYLKTAEEFCMIYEIYNSILFIRNAIAHAGYMDNKDFNEDIKNAPVRVSKVKKYVFDNAALRKIPDKYSFLLNSFIKSET